MYEELNPLRKIVLWEASALNTLKFRFWNNLSETYSTVVTAHKTLLIISAAVVSSENSVSKLQIIENYLQS